MLTAHSRYPRALGLAIAITGIIATIVFLPACGSSSKARSRAPARTWTDSAGREALVLSSPESLLAGGAEWERARLDDRLGSMDSPIATIASAAVIRHNEWLRDINGRPRNDSRTSSRSVQIRVGP